MTMSFIVMIGNSIVLIILYQCIATPKWPCSTEYAVLPARSFYTMVPASSSAHGFDWVHCPLVICYIAR